MTIEPIQNPFAASGLGESSMDFRQIGGVLVKKAWLIVLLGLVGAFGGFYYLKTRPHIYFAQAVLQVAPQENKIVPFPENNQADIGEQDMIENYVATLKSRPFLTQVVQANGLNSNTDFYPMAPGTVIPEDVAVNILAGCEEVLPRINTRFIEVGVKFRDPKMAQFLANALCTELIKQGMQQRAANAKLAVDFLEGEAMRLKDDTTKAESAQEDYVEKHNSISLQQSQDTVVSDMRHEATELQAARSATIRLQADDEAVKKAEGNPDALLSIPSVAENPLVVASKQQISELEANIAVLNLRYTDMHPKMIQAKSQLQEAKAHLGAILAHIPDLVHNSYESALAKQQKFEFAEKAREKEITDLNRQSIDFNVLRGNVEIKRALYAAILKQLGETRVASGVDSSPVQIFEKALLPGAPMAPGKIKVLALAIVAGLAVGVGIALGLNALDSSLKSVEQAERVTGLPVAGAIPTASRRLARSGLILQREPGSAVAEAFRSLRTFLFFKGKQKRPKTVLFTSAVPGEGKTFCSINCAISLAQQGLRTVLVDADLRTPAVARVLIPNDESEGLTSVLQGGIDLKKAIKPLEIDSLFLLAGGRIAGNPAELLASPEFANLVMELEEQFDCVIIDSAPVLPVCDTLLLVPHAQSVCLVTQANKTPRKAVMRTIKLLNEAGGSLAGLLLNMLSPTADPDHYVYRQKYGSRGTYGAPVTGRALPLPSPKQEAPAES